MPTIINNQRPEVVERTSIERTTDNSTGWGVAVIILLVVIAAAVYFWMRYNGTVPTYTAPNGTTNVNVTVPNPTTPSSGTTNNTSAAPTY